MDPLEILESVLSHSMPAKPVYPMGGAFGAYSPEVLVPGALEWIDEVDEYARKGYVTRGGLRFDINSVNAKTDGIEVKSIVTGSDSFSRSVTIIKYPSQSINDLCHGKWATFGGWEFRLIDGLKIPELEEYGVGFNLHVNVQVRLKGLLWGWVGGVINRIYCDVSGGEIYMSGVTGHLIAPRLKWGVADGNDEAVSESAQLETKLQAVIDKFQMPATLSPNSKRKIRKRWSKRACRQEMKTQAGITSMLLWWLLSSALKAIILRMADKYFRKIHDKETD